MATKSISNLVASCLLLWLCTFGCSLTAYSQHMVSSTSATASIMTLDGGVNETEEAATAKVLRHVVNIKYKADVPQRQVKKAIKKFVAIQKLMLTIQDFDWGENVSQEGHDKGFTHCFILTFANEADRDAYLVHPDHLELVAMAKPVIEDLLVMDYWSK